MGFRYFRFPPANLKLDKHGSGSIELHQNLRKSDGVHVDDGENAAAVLIVHPLLDGAKVVAQVQGTSGLDARKGALTECRHTLCR